MVTFSASNLKIKIANNLSPLPFFCSLFLLARLPEHAHMLFCDNCFPQIVLIIKFYQSFFKNSYAKKLPSLTMVTVSLNIFGKAGQNFQTFIIRLENIKLLPFTGQVLRFECLLCMVFSSIRFPTQNRDFQFHSIQV